MLVQGTDGVGTKLKVALKMGIYDTIGYDLVAMCANDVLCVGAEPIAFLDYMACGKLDVPVAAQIVKGISEACRETHCALIGGETAEMPTMYATGKYDLAGYCCGVVEHENILPKLNDIKVGDMVIGLPSSGVHSNGFSLVNKIMDITGEEYTNIAPFSKYKMSFGREFLQTTVLYARQVLPVIRKKKVKAIAHITGGGLINNIPRVLPSHLAVEIDARNFVIPPVFGWLAAKGNISDDEMLQTFNCGIGMVLIVPNEESIKTILPRRATVIGYVKERVDDKPQVVIEHFSKCMNEVTDKYRSITDDKIPPISYKDSGVDIKAGDDLVTSIGPLAKTTSRLGLIGGLGGFSGMFRLNQSKVDR